MFRRPAGGLFSVVQPSNLAHRSLSARRQAHPEKANGPVVGEKITRFPLSLAWRHAADTGRPYNPRVRFVRCVVCSSSPLPLFLSLLGRGGRASSLVLSLYRSNKRTRARLRRAHCRPCFVAPTYAGSSVNAALTTRRGVRAAAPNL